MKRFVPVLIAVFAVVLPCAAFAQDADAKKLQKKAMDEDYLSTDYAAAETKLTQAIQKCSDSCQPNLRALLRRDLGIVHVTSGKKDAAIKDFVEALAIDSSIKLAPDLKTKEIEAAWNDALKKSGPAGGGAGESVGGPDEVTLKNGGLVRGTVLSSEPGTSVKILEYGETKPRTIPWSEVSDVERGKYATKKPSVQPGPTEQGYDEPKTTKPTRKQVEAPSDGDTSQTGVIRLHIDTPRNAVVREFQNLGTVHSGNVTIFVQGVRAICSSPCDEVLDGRTGNRFIASGDFPGNYDIDVASSHGDMNLRITPGNSVGFTLGLVGIFVGGAAAAAGGVTWMTAAVLVGSELKDASGMPRDPSDHNGKVDLQNIGIGVFVAGAAVLVGSVVLRIVSRSSFDFQPHVQASGFRAFTFQ